MVLDKPDLEEKIRNYAENWPSKKLELYPTDIIELLDEKDLIIFRLKNQIKMLRED